MSSEKIDLKLMAKDIGPLNLDFSTKTDSLNIALFATNGSGKTFISRCFDKVSKHLQGQEFSNLDYLINFDEDSASFEFDFSNSTINNTLEMTLKRGQKPQFNLTNNWILHVFNREFVEQNVEVNNYSLNSEKITGEILIGDDAIDVAEDEKVIKVNEDELKKYELNLKESVQKCIEKIDILKINKRINEYQNITYENILRKTDISDISFEKAKINFDMVKNIPEDLSTLKSFTVTFDFTLLDEIPILINKSVSIMSTGDEFKQKMKTKFNFIQDGLNLLNQDTICPFCEKPINDKQDLITQYQQYFMNEEAKCEKNIEGLKIRLEHLKLDIEKNFKDAYRKFIIDYSEQKVYFSKLENVKVMDYPENETALNAVESLIELLGKKSIKKSETNFDFNIEEKSSLIKSYFEKIEELQEHSTALIKDIEVLKANISDIQLNSRKELCIAAFDDLYVAQKENVEKIKTLNTDIASLKDTIEIKKAKNKKCKKTKVNEVFQEYLCEFFGDKYTFNSEKSCLFFKNIHRIEDGKAKNILSDGEKNIIGFCYYLALTHSKINKKADYQKLFFLIDDPISSMDYHYVYRVSEIIKKLKQKLELSVFRLIILTHSFEFMNLLVRNNITSTNLKLFKNELTNIDKKIILPYEEHLKLIKSISEGGEISYQAPNSIRHVLETICNFYNPKENNLNKFIDSQEILSDCEYLKTGIQDLSHGIIRHHKPCTEDDIKAGCDAVIVYIDKNFKGQLSAL